MDFLDLLQASVFLVTAWATVKPLRFQFSSCAGNVEVSFNSLPPDAWQHLLNLFLWGCLHFRGTIQFKFVSPHGLMTSATSQPIFSSVHVPPSPIATATSLKDIFHITSFMPLTETLFCLYSGWSMKSKYLCPAARPFINSTSYVSPREFPYDFSS